MNDVTCEFSRAAVRSKDAQKQLARMSLIGPLKPYLAENISLQSSNCNILGLAVTVAFFANEARSTQI